MATWSYPNHATTCSGKRSSQLPAFPGKTDVNRVSSTFGFGTCAAHVHHHPADLPAASTSEAPYPVETKSLSLPLTTHPSFPQPVIDIGDGASKSAIPGKYAFRSNRHLPHIVQVFSEPPLSGGSMSDNLEFAASSTVRREGALPLTRNITVEPATVLRTAVLMYYQNVRGLRTKIDELFVAASDCDYDIIALTETGLNNCITDVQLFGDCYCVYRCDRNPTNSDKSSFGGVWSSSI